MTPILLIVDEDASVRRAVGRLFRDRYRVEEAATGPEGLDVLASLVLANVGAEVCDIPSIVVLADISSPTRGAAVAFAQGCYDLGVPVILWSGSPVPVLERTAVAVGAPSAGRSLVLKGDFKALRDAVAGVSGGT